MKPILTKRQQEVLWHYSLGHPAKRLAFDLGVKEGTIAQHIENIYNKLKVNDRMCMLRQAIILDLIDFPAWLAWQSGLEARPKSSSVPKQDKGAK